MLSTTPPSVDRISNETLQSKTDIADQVPFVDDEEGINKRIVLIFHITVSILVLLLLLSPVQVLYRTVSQDYSEVFYQSYGYAEGLFIAALGWLGVFVGAISWWWFIGYFFISKKIRTGLSLFALAFLSIFFIACLVGLRVVFNIGESNYGGGRLGEFLCGYYIYIILIAFLMLFSILLAASKKVTLLSRYYIVSILSFLAVASSLVFFVYLNPFFRPGIIDNLPAYAVEEKVREDTKNYKLFGEAVRHFFKYEGRLELSCSFEKCERLYFKAVYDKLVYEDLNEYDIKKIIAIIYAPKIAELVELHLQKPVDTKQTFYISDGKAILYTIVYTCKYVDTRKLECSF